MMTAQGVHALEIKQTADLLSFVETNLKKIGVNIYSNFFDVLQNDRAFKFYLSSLSEGLNPALKSEFFKLAENARLGLIESSIYGYNPQALLIFPILRKFWPKFVTREIATVLPIDKPRTILAFIMPKVTITTQGSSTTSVDLPLVGASNIPSLGLVIETNVTVPGTFDLLSVKNLTPDVAHIERDLKIVGFTAKNGNNNVTGALDVTVDDMGHFSFEVTVGGEKDFVTGYVDFFTGRITLSGTRSKEDDKKVISVRVKCFVSYEENKINPQITWETDYRELIVKDHKLSAMWSVELQQDVSAYFDINAQAEFVSMMANQLALDIDNYIINHMIMPLVSAANFPRKSSFSKTPPTGFAFGPKQWYENIVVELNKVSAQIYNETFIQPANYLIMNPLTAAVLKSAQVYTMNIDSVASGGAIQQAPAVVDGVLGNTWTVVVSPVVPENKIILLSKPEDVKLATFIFAPYRPLTLMPYPLGPKVSVTAMSRYAATWIRPEGVGLVELV